MKLLLPTFALAVAFLIPSVCFAEDSLAPYATEAEVLDACIISSFALTIKLVKFSRLTSMFFILESEVSTFFIY